MDTGHDHGGVCGQSAGEATSGDKHDFSSHSVLAEIALCPRSDKTKKESPTKIYGHRGPRKNRKFPATRSCKIQSRTNYCAKESSESNTQPRGNAREPAQVMMHRYTDVLLITIQMRSCLHASKVSLGVWHLRRP